MRALVPPYKTQTGRADMRFPGAGLRPHNLLSAANENRFPSRSEGMLPSPEIHKPIPSVPGFTVLGTYLMFFFYQRGGR